MISRARYLRLRFRKISKVGRLCERCRNWKRPREIRSASWWRFTPESRSLACCSASVRQCSLHEGGMCLGMDLRACGPDPERAAKELLFACAVNGFQTKMREPAAMPTKTAENSMHH